MSGPLSGIRVLDFGQLIAGPWIGQMLGDFGADVIKVERPDTGEIGRTITPPFLKDKNGEKIGHSALTMAMNRNKRSIEVDITSKKGQALIKRLIPKVDIVIENLRAGTMQRYELDYESLRAIRPDLIYCSVSGYGQTGPYRNRSAKDSSLQAMSGLMSLNGDRDGPPYKVGFPIADVTAGLYGVIAVQSALRYREVVGGGGQYIDLSLLDCQIATIGHRFQSYLSTGVAPTRNGNAPPNTAMARPFRCADEWIMISADADNEFPVFCQAIGHPELAADPRFSSQGARVENLAALLTVLEPILGQKSGSEWITLLSERRIICAPIYSIAQVFDDPQVQARGMKVHVNHPRLGETSILANPIRFSASPITEYRAPSAVGEHTEEVLRELLDLSEEDVQDLRSS
jgi:crotonobetainyl-CoA:carnitine CoA-transferase CaiB-like acyl-CoA transferase